MISIVVAISQNNVIGKNNQLVWTCAEDMKRFRNLTVNNTVVMGRKTFESLPNKQPLKNRRNVVISRTTDSIPGIEVYSSVEEALSNDIGENVFIIGGGEIYKQTINLVDKLFVTQIHQTFDEHDAIFFPQIDLNIWEVEANSIEEFGEYTFLNYVRK